MEESVTYQAIVRKARIEEARRILLFQGELRYGPPDTTTRAVIEALSDLAQLEELAVRFVRADSWQELLAPPARRRRHGRRKARN